MEENFVICINNTEYPASLELLKIYKYIPDKIAETKGYIRVIDESGEDYLYLKDYFIALELPKQAIDVYDKVYEESNAV